MPFLISKIGIQYTIQYSGFKKSFFYHGTLFSTLYLLGLVLKTLEQRFQSGLTSGYFEELKKVLMAMSHSQRFRLYVLVPRVQPFLKAPQEIQCAGRAESQCARGLPYSIVPVHPILLLVCILMPSSP